MSKKKRKEYGPGDILTIRITEKYEDEIKWINAQENVGQSLFELIRQHLSQERPSWLQELSVDIKKEFSDLRNIIANVKVFVPAVMSAPEQIDSKVDDRTETEIQQSTETAEKKNEVNEEGREAALAMMEWG